MKNHSKKNKGYNNPSYSEEEIFIFPSSFAQQRLWFLHQYQPNSAMYNYCIPLRLNGSLNVDVLINALKEIVRRHESLRTTFKDQEGQPVQVISLNVTTDFIRTDLRELLKHEREEKVMQLVGEEAQNPFDLSEGPLFRVRLIQFSDKQHILVLNMHHIISDGWSMGLFIEELTNLYEAFLEGRPSPLSDLSIQYADFSIWQKDWMKDEVLEEQLSYWRNKLGGDLPVLQLPTDRPRPARQTFRGAIYTMKFPEALSNQVKELSKGEDATLFMTLLAAFKTLLYRYTGQEDLLIGTPIANRNQKEIENLIGFFVNTLVLRTKLSQNSTFRELLQQVREVSLEAYTYQDFPFEKLAEELQPQRDMSYSPLFQVMFVFQTVTLEPKEFSGISMLPEKFDNKTAQFDLTLSMEETAKGLISEFEYNTDLFDEGTIERMAGHFQTLMEGIVTDPNQNLGDLPIMPEEELHQLLNEFNDTPREYPAGKTLSDLFEEQVEKTPQSVAVVYENEQLTYQELNERSNQLAHYLREKGVGPEVIVGICVNRSLEMAIGILGVLKAGGAYLPIDPEYPKDRIRYMIEDSGLNMLLAQQYLTEKVKSNNIEVVNIEDKRIYKKNVIDLKRKNTPNDLAYIIYTSGSTGKPKGVMIEHKSIINTINWHLNNYKMGGRDVVLQIPSFSFDSSVVDIFTTLLSGAKLVFIKQDMRLNFNYLERLIEQYNVSHILVVPSFYNLLLKELKGSLGTLKFVTVAGESMSDNLMHTHFENLPDVKLYNEYGPTETAVCASIKECKAGLKQSTCIGKPIDNTQIYILDKNIHPVPIGVIGEIHIAGLGISRGYLNRLELTGEKFIQNPFSHKGTRLYKTGDLGRYLPNGEIEFIGRIDHQVNIRGHRIELGEIESVLCQHPGVSESVVVIRKDYSGELIAYVVPVSKLEETLLKIREWLRQKLPEYMIPTHIVTLETLPLTTNGKVDRDTLPALDLTHLTKSYVSPKTEIELLIQKVWKDVLKIKEVSITQSFFELGGHSLLAIQIIFRLSEQLQIEIPVRSIFESPTIEEFAIVIEQLLFAELQELSDEDTIRLLQEKRDRNGGIILGK
jgi:amino acid adenylation domain-containing protein